MLDGEGYSNAGPRRQHLGSNLQSVVTCQQNVADRTVPVNATIEHTRDPGSSDLYTVYHKSFLFQPTVKLNSKLDKRSANFKKWCYLTSTKKSLATCWTLVLRTCPMCHLSCTPLLNECRLLQLHPQQLQYVNKTNTGNVFFNSQSFSASLIETEDVAYLQATCSSWYQINSDNGN